MIVAHVMGIPIEESVVQLVPAGAAIVTAVAIAGRATLDRLRRSGRVTPRVRLDRHAPVRCRRRAALGQQTPKIAPLNHAGAMRGGAEKPHE
jgi:hypothetical protein